MYLLIAKHDNPVQWATWVIKKEKNLGWGEIFSTCLERPWDPPSLLYNVYRVFPGDRKRPGRDAGPSPRSRSVV
jgi:hypothetical protein